MEHTTEQEMATTDQAWKSLREEATTCPEYDVKSLVGTAMARWKSASIGYRAMAYAQLNGNNTRILARSLREAEQSLGAVLALAFPVCRKNDDRGVLELMGAHMRCQFYIALPVARRMAEQDDQGRSADEFAWFVAEKAPFLDGRPVIDQALASELSCPYKFATA